MRRIGFLLMCAVLLGGAGRAQAQCDLCWPYGNSTAPSCISLVASDGSGAADPAGSFSVVVRDLANNTIAGAIVRVDFSHCPELRLCSQQQSGLHVECAPALSYVEGVTDANGVFTASLMGYSTGGAVTLNSGGRIFVDGYMIAAPSVSAFDLAGSDGVGANDLSAWFGDFGSGPPFGRSDYDCSGNLGANDLSIWLRVFGAGRSSIGCGNSCP